MKGNEYRSEYNVQAVLNAIKVLETLGNCDHEQSPRELSEKLDMTKSSVDKTLYTLSTFGYVHLNSHTGNYTLGVKTFQISQAYINKLNLSEVALPIQRDVVKKVNESCYISCLHKRNVVYLGVVEADNPVKVVPRIGNIGLAYATATGKVQLAQFENRDIELLYNSHDFETYTSNTIADIDTLLQELNVIRTSGYAFDMEEYENGVSCIAMPVYNFMGNVIASISVSAPTFRINKKKMISDLLPPLKNASRKLSSIFGYKQ